MTPGGEPRSRGVVYQAAGHCLVVAVAPDSWKAKHVATNIEILPQGAFRTYCLGVSLRTMLDPAAAQARVPIAPEDSAPHGQGMRA